MLFPWNNHTIQLQRLLYKWYILPQESNSSQSKCYPQIVLLEEFHNSPMGGRAETSKTYSRLDANITQHENREQRNEEALEKLNPNTGEQRTSSRIRTKPIWMAEYDLCNES